MPDIILLSVGVIAIILGWIEFKLHPFIGIVTQVISSLILLGVVIGALGYGDGFLAFFTMNVFLVYVTVIALGLTIGNAIAELIG